MSLKTLLGLENTDLSETEILQKLQEAIRKNIPVLEFTTPDGKKTEVKINNITDFSKYLDPWDGKQGKGSWPHI